MAAVYFHIPFCKKACHYCNFHFSTSIKNKASILDAMLSELKIRKLELKSDYVINSIYFGGGTPSLLSANEIEILINSVRDSYVVSESVEITLEMNPDDYRPNYLFELKKVGVNRLSVGIQSFHEEELKLMNRAHNAQEAFEVLEEVKTTFQNFSLDLIYGLPYSTLGSWKQNIDFALKYSPKHISSYVLTVEPKTVLKHQIETSIVESLDEEIVLSQFNYINQKLVAEGFEHYELSSFGIPGFRSVNNSAYWSGDSYLGIGPSAHSFDGSIRSWNVSNNTKYIKGIALKEPVIEREKLTKADQYNEYLMTGLRKEDGVSMDFIENKFGSHFRELLEKEVEPQIASKILYWDGDVLKISRDSMFLVDGVASDLFILNS
jgi:oxygen-independent coproporphyrinogen-3 oxidase